MALRSAYDAACASRGVAVHELLAAEIDKVTSSEENPFVKLRCIVLDGAHHAVARCRLKDDDVEALAEALSGSVSRAVDVRLENHSIGDAGVRALSRAVSSGAISRLSLRNNISVGLEGVSALAEACGSKESAICWLGLDGVRVENAGAEKLAEVMRSGSSLRGLSLNSCGVQCRGIVALCAAVREGGKCALEEVSIDAPDLNVGWDDEDAAYHVARLVAESEDLKRLSLRRWPRSSGFMSDRLAEALERNTSLESIDLSGNRFGPIASATFAAAVVSHPSLHTVRLDACRVGERGAKAWAAALLSGVEALQNLHLNHAEIAADGIIALLDAASQRSAPFRVHLWGNSWEPHAAKRLEELLQADAITHKTQNPQTTPYIDVSVYRVDESDQGVRAAQA